MNRITKHTRHLALILAVSVALTSCTPANVNTLTNTLETITLASEIAIDIIAATGGVDPTTLQLASTYITAVDKATVTAATILASGESDTQKAADVIKAFQSAIVPVLGPNVNPKVVAVVNAVAAGVQVLLSHFNTSAVVVTSIASPSDVAKVAARTSKLPTATAADKTRLKTIAARASVASGKAANLPNYPALSPAAK